MTHAVQILAMSDSTNVCSLIYDSLHSEGYEAMCVPSPQEALRLLQDGLVTNYLLFDAAQNKSRDGLLPALLQTVSSDSLSILSEMGNKSWWNHAAKWSINAVLTEPLLRQDLERLTSRLNMAPVSTNSFGSSPP